MKSEEYQTWINTFKPSKILDIDGKKSKVYKIKSYWFLVDENKKVLDHSKTKHNLITRIRKKWDVLN